MELFCAILTAVLFWLFIYHCFRGHRVRARRKAGRLLLRFRKPRKLTYVLWMMAIMAAIGCFVFAVLVFDRVLYSPLSPWEVFFTLHIAMQSVVAIWIMGTQRLELREHGIVSFSNGPVVFAPWHLIKYCKWKPAAGKLFIQYTERRGEYPICPEQIDEANAILMQYAEVRGRLGKTAGDADHRRRADNAEAAERPEPEVRRLQFSLRTLLLFMLVCSAAFSWLGIRIRDWSQQQQTITRFEEMQPVVTHSFNNVRSLDFSNCKIKPTDKDLAYLGNLPRLKHLNLTGAPITDAGLKHLEGITSLRFVSVFNTQVTPEAVEELRQALPRATICHESHQPVPTAAAQGAGQD